MGDSTLPADPAYAPLGVSPEAVTQSQTVEEKKKTTRRALCCSFLTLILSIPAIIGA
jgi:hypothetical protein